MQTADHFTTCNFSMVVPNSDSNRGAYRPCHSSWKFIKPADAISCGNTDDSAMFDNGIKKKWHSKAHQDLRQCQCKKSASVVQNERIKVTPAQDAQTKTGQCTLVIFGCQFHLRNTMGDMDRNYQNPWLRLNNQPKLQGYKPKS